MTREEALSLYSDIRYNLTNSRHKEAVDMAFEALRDREVVTNADSIRAMSDEELAKWFADMWDCSYCSEDERLGGNPLLRGEQCDGKCDQHCLEWLKQPVEEG